MRIILVVVFLVIFVAMVVMILSMAKGTTSLKVSNRKDFDEKIPVFNYTAMIDDGTGGVNTR